MTSSEALQKIFDKEIARLHAESEADGLDISGLKRLEMLVGAYSKYKDQRLGSSDELDSKSTEELMKELNNGRDPTRKTAKSKDKGGPVETG